MPFASTPPKEPQIVLTRKRERRVIRRDPQNSDITYHALTGGRANRRMNPFLLEVPPAGGRTVSRPHEGEEFLLVLSGRVTLEYGDESFALTEGDSLYFDAETPHRLHNSHKRAAQVLCVFLEKQP